MLDHVIIALPMNGRQGYFSFQGSRNDWLKRPDIPAEIKAAEIIPVRPLPDHLQSNPAAYISCQVEAEFLSGL
jgi:hypothetical protein